MNEPLTLPEKKKKRFALGGVFCILCSLCIGTEFLLYALLGDSIFSVFSDIIFYFQSSRDIYILCYSFEVLNLYITYAVFTVSFLVMGILLLCKVHSRLLIAIPIIQIAVLVFKAIADLVNDILWIVSSYGGYYVGMEGIEDGRRDFFEDLFVGRENAIAHLLRTLPIRQMLTMSVIIIVCALTVTIIILNCGKNKGGRFGAMKFIIPAVAAFGGIVQLAESIGCYLIKSFLLRFAQITDPFGYYFYATYSFSAKSTVVRNILFMFDAFPEFIQNILVGCVDIALSIIPFALIILAVFFSVSWIIKPYKKNTDVSESAADVTETADDATEGENANSETADGGYGADTEEVEPVISEE